MTDAATSDAGFKTDEIGDPGETAEHDAFETPEPRSGLMKRAGIGAAVLLVLGCITWGAFSLLGGDTREPTRVLARPKPAGSTTTPIAGIEAVPSPASAPTTPPQPALHEGLPGDAATSPDIWDEIGAIDERNTAPAEGGAELAPDSGSTLGMRVFGGDPLEPDMADADIGPSSTGPNESMAAAGVVETEAAEVIGVREAAVPPAAPAPAPAHENPADAEVDAPFW